MTIICANLVMDAIMRRTAVASQQLYQNGRPGHQVQHAHYRRRGLHQQVYEMQVYFSMDCNCKSRVCIANLSTIVELILRVLYCSGNRDHEYVLDANALLIVTEICIPLNVVSQAGPTSAREGRVW